MHAYPDGHVFYRNLTRSFPRIVAGEGCWLVDAEGRRYLDGCSGAFVASLGHGNAEVADALADQARRLAYVNGTMFTHDSVEALAAELAGTLPGDLDHLYFLSSGSEAVEAALKLARQYWVERSAPEKRTIIALSPAYHGNTLLALSASARGHYQAAFREWLIDVVRIPAPVSYRCGCGGDPTCPVCSGGILEAAIEQAGPERVAAFIAEPVGGSSTGAAVPRPEYFATVREICDRHDVLLVADEVLCGAGRTGTWWAMTPTGVVPDIMTIGKGIAGGYAPLSAVAAPRRIVDVLARGSGSLRHAQTFSFHPVACAAGLAAVRYIERHGLVERCAALGALLQEKLATLTALPHVGDVRGRGLLAGIELVQDPVTRAPFPRARRVAESVVEHALAAGLVVWPNVGHVDGTDGDLILLAPPFIATESELDELVTRLVAALERALDVQGVGTHP
jgi:adenosylmethionine-8-amino-7-oxononanoate aminotransferase